MIALNKTIKLFLDSIGRREEYEFYLKKFHSNSTACFALLCPDLESLDAGADVLAFDLHFLLRLELIPAILLSGPKAAAMRSRMSGEPAFEFFTLEDGAAGESIAQARKAEKIPVLVAESLSLEEALLKLVPEIATRVHFIRAAGGIKSVSGASLAYAYTHKKSGEALAELEYDFLGLAKSLLTARPGVHLSVTSPINLLKEIFTVKGAGTLFRVGSSISHFPRTDGVSQARLVGLLEAAFGKTLSDSTFLSNVAHSYIEEHYRGAVLLEEHPAGLYLSKFAVGREARGEGLALELWNELCCNHSALFWRSNATNPFNSWYDQQADGHHTSGKWRIFWRGIEASNISAAITYCCDRGEDFAS